MGILPDSFSILSPLILPGGGPRLDAPCPCPPGHSPVDGGRWGEGLVAWGTMVLPILVHLGAWRWWAASSFTTKITPSLVLETSSCFS